MIHGVGGWSPRRSLLRLEAHDGSFELIVGTHHPIGRRNPSSWRRTGRDTRFHLRP